MAPALLEVSNFRHLLTHLKENPRDSASLQHTQVSWSVSSEQKLRPGRDSRFRASNLLESLLAASGTQGVPLKNKQALVPFEKLLW